MAENKQKKASAKKAEKKSHLWLWILILLGIWWLNNFTLKNTETSITSEKVSSKVRFAVISDQHATKHGIKNDTIVQSIKDASPDIVFMLGDMYTRKSEWELIQKPIDLTRDLVSAGYPVYCVTGEHDTDERYISELGKAGAHVLSYDEETVDVNGSRLHIMGIDNVYYSPTFDLNTAFSLDDSSYNILLAHIPNYEKFAEFGADLTLCGDTHGEMAQLPFGGGPLYCSDKKLWLPKLLHKKEKIYDKGFFDYEGGTMFITSGIGVYPAPVRFNNRPEVVIMDIRPKG
ncbi:metallophosphoesterase [Ruminococcus sp.]|uniref:metallophosphoesterase n=1 Tax=Ruminococcus sp. TaxID=41978 RepID=UPI0025CE5A6F|nr:metallophosphoesterase [Ruminococcus sp.]MCR4640056.1 metallophosphoesterase [Ruminococcus sp.]